MVKKDKFLDALVFLSQSKEFLLVVVALNIIKPKKQTGAGIVDHMVQLVGGVLGVEAHPNGANTGHR